MRRIDRWAATGLCFLALTMLPAASFGQESESELYDCGKRNCTEWAPKGENTCRTCSTAQCRKNQDGEELLVGEKKQSQCYEGHGSPPQDTD